MGFVLGLGSLRSSTKRIAAMASVVVFNLPFWLVALAEKAWHEQKARLQNPAVLYWKGSLVCSKGRLRCPCHP